MKMMWSRNKEKKGVGHPVVENGAFRHVGASLEDSSNEGIYRREKKNCVLDNFSLFKTKTKCIHLQNYSY